MRYCDLPFPRYAFIPGRHPHPRRHPDGHSHGLPEPAPTPFDPQAWRDCACYLHGVDLFNHGYYWECHEAFEALWRGAGRRTEHARFVQALIQLAAAALKTAMEEPDAAARLRARATAALRTMPPRYMGLDVCALLRELDADARGTITLALQAVE